MNNKQLIAAVLIFVALVALCSFAFGAQTNRFDVIVTSNVIVRAGGVLSNATGGGAYYVTNSTGVDQTGGAGGTDTVTSNRVVAAQVTNVLQDASITANSLTGAQAKASADAAAVTNAAQGLSITANSLTGSTALAVGNAAAVTNAQQGLDITANSLTGSLNSVRSTANSVTGALNTARSTANSGTGATHTAQITSLYQTQAVLRADAITNIVPGTGLSGARAGATYYITNTVSGGSGGGDVFLASNNHFNVLQTFGGAGYDGGGIFVSNANITADSTWYQNGAPMTTNRSNMWWIDQTTTTTPFSEPSHPAVSFMFGYGAYAIPTPIGAGSYAIGPYATAAGTDTMVFNLANIPQNGYTNHGENATFNVYAQNGHWFDGGPVTVTNTLVISNTVYIGGSALGPGAAGLTSGLARALCTVRVPIGTNQGIPGPNIMTRANFPSTIIDTHAGWSNAISSYVTPIAGCWEVGLAAPMYTNTASAYVGRAALYTNEVEYIGLGNAITTGPFAAAPVSGGFVTTNLPAGTRCAIYVSVSASGGSVLQTFTNPTPIAAFFSLSYEGQ